ncbi:Hypothetical protein FKW44_016798 [Caligus rogercresseyi]|uniref:Uncharacterized protein n=1 Tax=Caligus rogercresseyi TaxID=217165 RepID=A0A7T8K1F3_CALRO|nr:Hypothetical protein FKW44_016798 [Caligus rogercresseyi]
MNVDKKTIGTAVHEDLRSKSYMLKVRRTLLEASKAKIGSRTICPCSGRKRYGPLEQLL